MIRTSLEILGSSPQDLYATMILSTQLLSASKFPVTAKSGFPEEKIKSIEIHASQVTATLKNIEGYSYDGLNE